MLLVVVDVAAQHVGELRSSVALGAILSIRRSSPRSGLRDLPLETAPPHFSSKAGTRPQVKRRCRCLIRVYAQNGDIRMTPV